MYRLVDNGVVICESAEVEALERIKGFLPKRKALQIDEGRITGTPLVNCYTPKKEVFEMIRAFDAFKNELDTAEPIESFDDSDLLLELQNSVYQYDPARGSSYTSTGGSDW